MISVTEARKLILQNCDKIKVETMPLSESTGYILAKSVHSLIDSPPFNQSAMDGYAFSFDERKGKNEFIITGEIPAGDYSRSLLKQSETVRIFTGSALPPGADTVVMQEKVIVNGDKISISDTDLKKGSNVRLQGSQVKKDEITLQEGQLLSPAAISFLAGTGIDKVQVFGKPMVSIIVTGKELIQPGNQLPQGKIYESNSFGLNAALSQINITAASIEVVDDDETAIVDAVVKRLNDDIIILTGGVSVGDYDFVSSALEKCGVEKVFHKVKQKPGKPLYFGRHNETLIFALPGNPAAVMSCFYQYVLPGISNFTHKRYFDELMLPLSSDYSKKPGLTHFLKGKTTDQSVVILNNQESFLLNSFALADCLVELEEEKEFFKKGELVKVSMIL